MFEQMGRAVVLCKLLEICLYMRLARSVYSVAVSVICLTYNQADYIAQCLESLVAQETSFPFEVIVHDDCSSDGTDELVKGFASVYPLKIKPLFEEENQYSQGRNIQQDIVGPHIRGRYVALCEGDDWWLDGKKLQRQFDYMESHPDTAGCAHCARVFNDTTGCYEGLIEPVAKAKDYSTDEIISEIAPFATNSLFYKRELHCPPAVYRGWGVGDYPLCIWLSTQGKFHYDPAIMSAYRTHAKGSWSVRTSASADFATTTYNRIIQGLKAFDAYTDGKYAQSVAWGVETHELYSALAQHSIRDVLSNKVFQSLPLYKKASIYLRFNNPALLSSIKRLTSNHG